MRAIAQVAIALLAAASVTVSAAPASSDASTLPDPLGDPAVFRNPPTHFRPKTRWWWATPYESKEFVEEIDAIAKAGFGGVELAFNTDGWATPEQRQALKVSVDAARRNKIALDMTMGASWPVTSPAVTGSNAALGEQELQYGRRDLVGPTVYIGPPPDPIDGRDGTLHAVTAARVVESGPPVVVPQQGPGLTPTGPGTAPVRSTILDPSSLVDLTKELDDSGTIAWNVPAGQWIVFAFWQRTSSENVMDHFRRESAEAVVDYIDKHMLGRRVAARLPGTGGSFFEDSLELDVAELMWTPRFAKEFRRRRGYDVTPYLPVLFVQGAHHYPVWEEMPNADFDLPAGAGDRIRHDYFETLTDLYVDEHFAPFQRWAKTHGMRFRTQAAFGAALDVIRSARALAQMGAIADDESLNAGDPGTLADTNWRFAMDHYRSVVGGVHQGGGREISTELGAMFWREYQPGLADYKALMDKEFAAGITTPIIHGFAYQTPGAGWPGRQQFAGVVSESWNHRNYPQWSFWRPLTDYWARANLVLQQGRPQTDVAVYRDGFTTTAATFWALGTDVVNHQIDPALPARVLTTPDGGEHVDDGLGVKPTPFFDGEPLERAGYTFQYIDPRGVLEPTAAGRGVLFPNGPSYRALVIDERALPGTTADAIARHAAEGLVVVFVGQPPSSGTGNAAASREDKRVRAAIDRMRSLPNVRRAKTQSEVRDALRDAGVRPAASWSQPVPVYSSHRRGDGADYWFLWNAGTSTAKFTGSFAASGAPHKLNLWTGSIERIALHRSVRGRIAVPMRLAPGETAVLAFRHGRSAPTHVVSTDAEEVVARAEGVEVRDTRTGRRTVRLSNGSTRRMTIPKLPSPITPQRWRLHVDEVDPNGPIVHEISLDELRDWREIPEISDASGVGTYTTSVTFPKEVGRSDRGVFLDVGLVEGAMQVFVNRERVVPNVTIDRPFADAPNVTADRRIDVSDLVHPGRNEIRVVVATTLKNKIVGITRSGRPAGGLASVQPATQPYGLLGPVKLIPYGRALLRP